MRQYFKIITSFSLRILSITVFVVDDLDSAMPGNGDVAALIANVKPNYRHLFLIKIRYDTLLG